MTAVLEANIARALMAVEEKVWEPNRFDAFGLCSKVSASHLQRRGIPVPKKKAEARS